jgi:hypothetical protein
MTEPRKTDLDPQDVVKGKSTYDPKALAGQPDASGQSADPGGKPQPTHEQVAHQTRIDQQARPESHPDRDDKLTSLGRGDQTHG